jgi:hypothetical protein
MSVNRKMVRIGHWPSFRLTRAAPTGSTGTTDATYLNISKWLHVVGAGASALSAYLASQAFSQTSVFLLQATVAAGGVAVVANAAGVAIAS